MEKRKPQPLTELSDELKAKILSVIKPKGIKNTPTISEQITNIELALVEIYEVMLNG